MADNDNSNNGTPAAPAVSPSDDHSKWKLEMELELEKVRKERAGIEAETAKTQVEINRLLEERAGLLQKQSLRAAVRDSGVKFHNNEIALKLVGEIEFDEDHNATVDGRPLADALQELALSQENLADGRSLKGLKAKREAADTTPKSKEDLAGNGAGKVAFINEHGLKAWENLPARRPVDLKGKLPNTWDEYQRLTQSERARVAGQGGPEFIAELHRKRAKA